MLQFDLPKEQSSIIKVIGVGGGGSNAVNYMHSLGIGGVDFVVCNTDAQSLATSSVPNKVQLGPSLTQGLGAGANPEIGRQATEESLDEIRRILEVNTKMAFVTAGMGGGTGTGGAPIISKICKDMGILTVGIVTTPFSYVPSTGTLTTKTYKASSVVGEVLTINGASLSSNAELTITTLAGVAGSEVYLGDGFVTINAPTTVTGDVDATGFSVAADAFTLTSGGIITKTAGFSLAATDNGKVITVNSATGVNVTVPTGLPVGFSATVIQLGAGQVTFVASSTTLNSYQGYLKTAGQHASASIVSYTTNVFNVAGALSA